MNIQFFWDPVGQGMMPKEFFVISETYVPTFISDICLFDKDGL